VSEQNRKYAVHISSRAGFYAQYDGDVKVWAADEEEAIERAFRELKRGAFPDRSRSMWKVNKVECIG
jgi:hypothetical protein